MKTFFKRMLITLSALVALLILFHLIENWRGTRALARWRAASVAAGEAQSLEQLVPPRIPDAENFGAHPLVAAAVAGQDQGGPVVPTVLADQEFSRTWADGRPIDLSALKVALKVDDLSTILVPFDAPLKGLEEASMRPHCRLMKTYDTVNIPALVGMRGHARVLSLRATISLRKGNSEAALTDILTILRVAEHLKLEPNLISHLLCIVYVNLSFQPIWEGLRDHRWNDQQLASLQQAIGRVNLLESWHRPWEAESLYYQRAMIDLASASIWPRPRIFGDQEKAGGRMADYLSIFLVPKGWIYQNMISMDRFVKARDLDVVDPVRHLINAKASDKALDEWVRAPRSPYTWLAKMGFGGPSGAWTPRMAYSQSNLDQAFIACALERFRLAHKVYPERIEELGSPLVAKIPSDIFGGKPLHYQRTDKDDYLLYSIGWNCTDEGGKRGAKGVSGSPAMMGDWVWMDTRNADIYAAKGAPDR